jgi:hypothetical protein
MASRANGRMFGVLACFRVIHPTAFAFLPFSSTDENNKTLHLFAVIGVGRGRIDNGHLGNNK